MAVCSYGPTPDDCLEMRAAEVEDDDARYTPGPCWGQPEWSGHAVSCNLVQRRPSNGADDRFTPNRQLVIRLLDSRLRQTIRLECTNYDDPHRGDHGRCCRPSAGYRQGACYYDDWSEDDDAAPVRIWKTCHQHSTRTRSPKGILTTPSAENSDNASKEDCVSPHGAAGDADFMKKPRLGGGCRNGKFGYAMHW